MRRDASSPKAYLADIEGEQQEMVKRLRRIIKSAAPGIREGIAHGMLDYPGLCNLAAQKHYVSLYTNMRIVERYRSRLGRVSCGKSCIRFRRTDQIDPDVVHELLTEVWKSTGRGW